MFRKLSDYKLTPEQDRVIRELMKSKEWMNAFNLHTTLNTLYALNNKGLVTYKQGLGSMFSPRTEIEFKSTIKFSKV